MCDQNKAIVSRIDAIVADTLMHRNDIQRLEITPSSYGSSYFYEGGPMMLSSETIFDDRSEDEQSALISFFLSDDFMSCNFNWDVNVQLAKLSAKKGHLAIKQVSKFIESNLDNWQSRYLQFACLGADSGNENYLVSLLNKSTEDFRDGLFIASWFLDTHRIYEALVGNFQVWHANNELESGTGELQSMYIFCDRWDKTYGKNGLHACLRNL